MKRLRLYILALAFFLPVLAAGSMARANCANPTDVQKKLIYNTTNHVWQFCDGTTWKAMGLALSCGAGAWTQQTLSGAVGWYGIASSSDGTKPAAVGADGYIYTSTDSGVHWTQRTSAGNLWNGSIASSSDGTKLVAGAGYI
jgi:hypothetical protein